ncbi:MAG: alpha/beta hydrolase, partial [Chitinophagaceae bacterium]
HGGAWSMGDRYYTDSHAKKLRDRGFVVANIEYRYVSESLSCEDLEQDVTDAVTKVKTLASEYGYSGNGYHIVGISAGAHLSLMHAYKNASQVKSVTSICGPVRFDSDEIVNFFRGRDLLPVIEKLAGSRFNALPDEKFTKISPYSIIKKVPTLLIHGTADPLVLYKPNAVFMEQCLKKAKVPAKLISIDGGDHSAGMSDPVTEAANLDAIAAWIRKFD